MAKPERRKIKKKCPASINGDLISKRRKGWPRCHDGEAAASLGNGRSIQVDPASKELDTGEDTTCLPAEFRVESAAASAAGPSSNREITFPSLVGQATVPNMRCVWLGPS